MPDQKDFDEAESYFDTEREARNFAVNVVSNKTRFGKPAKYCADIYEVSRYRPARVMASY